MSEHEDEPDALAHQHENGGYVACRPIRCPGCMNCPRDEED